MTTDVLLQRAQAAVGFAALTMGRTMAELETLGKVPEASAWQQATQAISQWLREQYGDDYVDQAKALLGDAAMAQESDDEEVAQAAQSACQTALALLLEHCVAESVAKEVHEHVTAAMQTSWLNAYGDETSAEVPSSD